MFSPKIRILSLVMATTLSAQLLSPLVLTTYADNTPYYVDATGWSDANDGLSPATAWQTLTHVSAQAYLPGDQILLKCGETWTDTLTMDDVGGYGTEIEITTDGVCAPSSPAKLSNTGAAQIHVMSGAADIRISGLVFSGGNWVLIENANNVYVTENSFLNPVGYWVSVDTNTELYIQNNYFRLSPTATGIILDTGDYMNISNNSLSGGTTSIEMLNVFDVTVNNNVIHNPSRHAISLIEDSSVAPETVNGNTISNNTLLTWNPSYPMIHMDDQNDALGTLSLITNNTYLNVYKNSSSLIELLQNGTGTTSYDKNNVDSIDATRLLFTEFGYSSYNGNETRLLVNTGSTSANIACPGGTCPNYVSKTNTAIGWPRAVPAYSSEIVLLNNTANIQNRPTCTLIPSAGSIANGQSVDFTWTSVGASSTTFTEPTATGGSNTYAVASVGSGTYFPPINSGINHYEIVATNAIGTRICPSDITTQNNPPFPDTFFMTGAEDATSITGALFATDESGDDVYYSLYPDNTATTTASGGTITLVDGATGEVSYTPVANFCGIDTFEWYTYDEFGVGSTPQSIGTITVLCENDAPVVLDDTLAATGGQLGVLDVMANDTDVDSPYQAQTFTVSGITLPSNWVLTESGSVFEYTPDMFYVGTDTFMYVAIDQSGSVSNTGTVTINVAPGMNLPPIVSSGSFTLDEDASVSDTFSGSDQNGDPLTYSIVTSPANGIVGVVGASFTYTPTADYNGSDSFEFVANDGSENSNTGTITLTINSIMDAPVAVADTVNIEMNTPTSIDVIVNDTDADSPYQAQVLTLTGISAPSFGTASIVGNEIYYTPDNLYQGPDSIDYTIVDQDGNISNTATVSITVSTANQAPVADSGSFILTEDVPLTQTLSGSDPDMTPVTFVLDTDVSNGTLVLSSTGEFTYTPDADYNGSDSFTFHVTDSVFDSSIQTVTLTITAQNDNPFAAADAYTVNEDEFLDTTVLSNDYDVDVGDTFVLNSVTSPLNGTATITGSLITYTPTADYCGTDTFTYTTIDGSGATSNAGTVTMTVTCINDAPTASGNTYTATGNITTNSGNTLMGTLGVMDVDVWDTHTYSIIQNAGSGTLILTGSVFSYEPNIDFVGTDTFTYTVTDSGALTSSAATITINVLTNTYNEAPTTNNRSFTINEDSILSDTLTGSDLEWATLTYILGQNVSSGTLLLSSSWIITYTPNNNFYGTDIFTFQVNDGTQNSLIATGTITITSVNDAPISVNDTFTGSEDAQFSFDPLTNDTDVEWDVFGLYTYTGASNGSITASGDTLTYFPNADYCGTDAIIYTSMDSGLAVSNTGTINLSISCVNDAPVGIADTATGTEDTTLMIPVLSNDTDVEWDTLSVANITQPGTGGTVSISGSMIQFVPTTNYCTASPISFTYQARDTSSALSSATTVTLSSITCMNDAPTGTNTSYSMTGNVVINAGTMLSGGTLTGYLATENTLTRSLTAVDVDGDTVTFSGVTLTTHGTGTLSSTGLLTYIPTPGYIGTDTLAYVITDGTLTSSVVTVTITVQDPNPPVVVAPSVGAGGGGGWSSSVYSTPIYTSPKTTTSTNSGAVDLTSKLLLTTRTISDTTLLDTSSETVKKTYTEYIVPIMEKVEEAKLDPESSRKRAVAIRQSGQKLMHSLTRSLILTSIEKSEAIELAEENLSEVHSSITPSYESKALAYIIRLIKREKTKIKKGTTVVGYLLSI